MITDPTDRDHALRAFNEAGQVKQFMLMGFQEAALEHIDHVLSWCESLLGARHPMEFVTTAAPATQVPLLDQTGAVRLNRVRTPIDAHPIARLV